MPDGETFSPDSGGLTRCGSGVEGGSCPYRAGGGDRAGALGIAALHRARGIYVVLASDEQRCALMQLGGLDVQDSLDAIGRGPASLLDDERERVGLVKEPELPPLVFPVRGVSEEPAAQKVAVEIGDERADVAGIHRLPVSVLPTIVAHELLDSGFPLALIRVVHRQVSAQVGCADVGV